MNLITGFITVFLGLMALPLLYWFLEVMVIAHNYK